MQIQSTLFVLATLATAQASYVAVAPSDNVPSTLAMKPAVQDTIPSNTATDSNANNDSSLAPSAPLTTGTNFSDVPAYTVRQPASMNNTPDVSSNSQVPQGASGQVPTDVQVPGSLEGVVVPSQIPTNNGQFPSTSNGEQFPSSNGDSFPSTSNGDLNSSGLNKQDDIQVPGQGNNVNADNGSSTGAYIGKASAPETRASSPSVNDLPVDNASNGTLPATENPTNDLPAVNASNGTLPATESPSPVEQEKDANSVACAGPYTDALKTLERMTEQLPKNADSEKDVRDIAKLLLAGQECEHGQPQKADKRSYEQLQRLAGVEEAKPASTQNATKTECKEKEHAAAKATSKVSPLKAPALVDNLTNGASDNIATGFTLLGGAIASMIFMLF